MMEQRKKIWSFSGAVPGLNSALESSGNFGGVEGGATNYPGHVESQERRSGPSIIVNNLCFPSIASLSTLLLFPLKL